MILEKIHEEGMIPGERGIMSKKGIYFHSPSLFAKEHLFCVYWGAEYLCAPPYQVSRKGLHSYLFFCILSGELHFTYRDHSFTAATGDIVLLDCMYPHHYYTPKQVRFQFFHFDGNVTSDYCEYLYQKDGALFRNKSEAALTFQQLLDQLRLPQPDDHRLSALVHTLFGSLAAKIRKPLSSSIQKACLYLETHFQEPVTVEDAARQTALSKYHFSRVFKAETGSSPHEYLSTLRLRRARELVMETTRSIDAIAVECGFSSASHFIRAFKKDLDFTPAVYRKFFDPSDFQKSP